MTLCIAAACQDHGRDRVVIATDWKAGTEIAAADNQDKLYWITDDMPVMIAGTVSRAVELKDAYRSYFLSRMNSVPALIISPYNIGEAMKQPLGLYMNRRADEHTMMKFGLNYADFRDAVGKNQMPGSTSVTTYAEISRMDFGCELIIVTFVEGKSYIYRITEQGIESCDNFTAIGTGCDVAESALYQRKHESNSSLGTTVYRVYEAMKLGSIAPTVGKDHTINVLHPPSSRNSKNKQTVRSTMADLKDSTLAFLERKFRKFGPKEFKRISLPKRPFE